MSAVVCAAILLFSCAGCAEEPTPQPTTNSPTAAAPVFASDEEALAAATEAYANYQRMADQIDGEAGRGPERIAPYVSEDFLPTAIHQSDGFREANVHSIGATTFAIDGVQSLRYTTPEDTFVSLYICDDVSTVDVVDEDGESIVSESRVAITPFEVNFVPGPTGSLVVDSREVWGGDNFC
jgi:hypothetical protein